MQRFFKNTMVFLFVSMLAYVLIFWALCSITVGGTPLIYRTSETLNWKGGNSFVKFNEFNQANEYDFIFIGSSHAYRGYDTHVFERAGYTVFNLGSSAQTPLNSLEIIKDLITKENCVTVVIDVFSGALETNGLESTAGPYAKLPITCSSGSDGLVD